MTLAHLSPDTYVPHLLHTRERVWAESNCYVDLWVELLNGLGLEPRACLGFTLGLDFEIEQLTFFKFPLADLRAVFGIEVVELNVWRSLAYHIEEQCQAGRVPVVEMDSFFLPDTAGISYGIEHVKTSIAVARIDSKARVMTYFHGQGFHRLSGDDFTNVLRLGPGQDSPLMLAPYFEVAKLGRMERLAPEKLVPRAISLLSKHLEERPKTNPMTAFKARFAEDLAWLREAPTGTFHVYAFATLRQVGACFELCGAHLAWLGENGELGLDGAIERCNSLAEGARALMLKLARAVNGKRPLDAAALLDDLERHWAELMGLLGERFG